MTYFSTKRWRDAARVLTAVLSLCLLASCAAPSAGDLPIETARPPETDAAIAPVEPVPEESTAETTIETTAETSEPESSDRRRD